MFAYAKPEQKQMSKNTVQDKKPVEMPAYLNPTGIPEDMKERIKNLTRFSFDDVHVHYNSDKPAQLQALAYTQGNQVYIGPGQEKHLGHELGRGADMLASGGVLTSALSENTPANPVAQRLAVAKYDEEGQVRYRVATDKDPLDRVTETSSMEEKAKTDLVLGISRSGNQALVQAILTEPEIKALMDLSTGIDNLEKEEESKREKKREQIRATLISVKDYLDKYPYNLLIRDLFNSIRVKFPIGGGGATELALEDIPVEVVTDYKNQITTNATYGGSGEGSAIANIMHLKVPVYINHPTFGLTKIADFGTGNVPGNWALLHSTNHYTAIQVNINAQPATIAHEYPTAPDGNCMYEAFLIVNRKGRGMLDNKKFGKIESLRTLVNASITDEQVKNSIVEMAHVGNIEGVNGVTREFLSTLRNISQYDADWARKEIQYMKSCQLDFDFTGYGLDGIIKKYEEARTKYEAHQKTEKDDKEQKKTDYKDFLSKHDTMKEMIQTVKDEWLKKRGDSDPKSVQDWLTTEYWAPKKEQPEGSGGARALNAIFGSKPVNGPLETVGYNLLQELKKKSPMSSRLKLYKGIDSETALSLIKWFSGDERAALESRVDSKEAKEVTEKDRKGIMPITGHVGGFDQAKEYAEKGGQALVEFTLKPGAHELLFTPSYMAAAKPQKGAKQSALPNYFQKFPGGSGNEGHLGGYIGMKPEDIGPFSLALSGKKDGSPPTQLLFQLFVENVRIVSSKP